MSNYHILAADKYANKFNVVFHLAVPDQLNEAGLNYQAAIVEWQGGAPIQSVLPSIGGEQTQLDSGALYEAMEEFHSNPNETLIEKRDRLDTRFGELQTEKQAELQKVLSYWGYNRDVP